MTEQNQNPYQPAPNPYQPQATNPNTQPSNGIYGTEFGAEQTPNANANDTEFANEQNPLNNATNQAERKSAKEMEKKDARGGNNNPNGASGFTSGRVDDRGRKSKKDEMEKKSADPKAKDEARTHQTGVGFTDDERTGGNV